jgi:hypothetical protein
MTAADRTVRLTWQRFDSLTAARLAFKTTPCVYVQADREGRAVRVGKASKGLQRRYYGGTGWALDAAMHGSGNRVYAAATDCAEAVESTLIWDHRASLPYNNIGRRVPPAARVQIEHAGQPPVFT